MRFEEGALHIPFMRLPASRNAAIMLSTASANLFSSDLFENPETTRESFFMAFSPVSACWAGLQPARIV
jgi:hypothetical protein